MSWENAVCLRTKLLKRILWLVRLMVFKYCFASWHLGSTAKYTEPKIIIIIQKRYLNKTEVKSVRIDHREKNGSMLILPRSCMTNKLYMFKNSRNLDILEHQN